ncbi:MAG TPA: M42 family peptidase [Candidatus Eisenbacteria bacterium]|nr:M42 family peptidase [Candidatus Eisenbacteria bacterium]
MKRSVKAKRTARRRLAASARRGAPRFREDLLEALSNADGVSGGEDVVRALVADAVRDRVDSMEVDALGSLVARIGVDDARQSRGNGGNGGANGRPRPGAPHVMLCAHLDEVGIMITAIEKEGRLRFRRAGGLDPRLMAGQVFRIGSRGVRGVVGILPPHLTSHADEEKVIPFEDLYLDIGASSRDEAAEHVSLGDYGVFDTTYERWGSIRKGKAFDDRVGCAVLASLVQERPPVPVTAVWSVQEEVGLRGATAAARRVMPDVALVLEGTASGEAPGASVEESAPLMGGGPTLTVHDRTLMADVRLVELLRRTAASRRIATQWKRPGVGGTDAGRISLSGSGVPSAVISVACRYIHAPAAYLDVRDPERTVSLVWHALSALGKEWSSR